MAFLRIEALIFIIVTLQICVLCLSKSMHVNNISVGNVCGLPYSDLNKSVETTR